MYFLSKTIVLVGLMGSGKTAIGRILARRLSVRFADSDREIVLAMGAPIPEIFARQGEAAFRAAETVAVQKLLTRPPGVVSVGGGAFSSAYNRELIKARACSVWLDADVDMLWERLQSKMSQRPLLHKDGLATLTAMAEARRGDYEQADIRLELQARWQKKDTARALFDVLLNSPASGLRTMNDER